MSSVELEERAHTILLETVTDYITGAEPVGSRTLSKKLSERLSPATIRNVMADLEDMGYLYQPHTSAGRIPTDRGYRYFVNELLALPEQYAPPLASIPNHFGDSKRENLNDLLESACSLLSENSQQTGLVMAPSVTNLILKHIQFAKINSTQVLAVFISEMGILQNKILPVESSMTQEKLTSIANYLNAEFSGQSLKSIRKEIQRRMKHEKEHYNQLMKRACELWTTLFSEEQKSTEILIEGVNHLLDHPEFSADLKKMKSLMKTVEERDKLIKLLDLCMQRDGLTIIIGEENQDEEMKSCSLVAQNYQMEDEKIGVVAIFGPKRMDYLKMIGIVNSTANNVSEILSKRNQ